MDKIMNLQEIVETIKKCAPIIKKNLKESLTLCDIWKNMQDCLVDVEGAKCLGEIRAVEKIFMGAHLLYVIYYFPSHNIFIKRKGYKHFNYNSVDFSGFEPEEVFPVERLAIFFKNAKEIELYERQKEIDFFTI